MFAEVLTWVVPQSELIFYKEGETVLFDEWLKALPVKVQAKCLTLVSMLRSQGVNYRILYFFSGKNIVVISHGLSKKAEVPAIEIDRAMERKIKYEANPKVHGVKK